MLYCQGTIPVLNLDALSRLFLVLSYSDRTVLQVVKYDLNTIFAWCHSVNVSYVYRYIQPIRLLLSSITQTVGCSITCEGLPHKIVDGLRKKGLRKLMEALWYHHDSNVVQHDPNMVPTGFQRGSVRCDRLLGM